MSLRDEIKSRVDKRVSLITAFNNWQQVRARGNEVEISALLDISLKATQLAYALAEEKRDGHN